MDEYPNNSYAAKQSEEKKELPKVKLSAPPQTVKKTAFSKFGDRFLSEDRATVKSHLVNDVLIPGVTRVLADGLKDAVDIIFFGSARRDRRPEGTFVSWRDYGLYSRDPRRDDPPVRRSIYDFDELKFKTLGDAEDVLRALDDTIARFKIVTVRELYEIVGITAPYTADRYGWTDIRMARPVRGRDGWILDLPKPMLLD